MKAGLALALFGGCQKHVDDKNRIPVRGDPHILVVGDPGLGKSQMLQVTHTHTHTVCHTRLIHGHYARSSQSRTLLVHTNPNTQEHAGLTSNLCVCVCVCVCLCVCVCVFVCVCVCV